jgi:S-(hydroxymethyl)glutathione dehydrogenase/alcohol dehydrogenase
VTTFSELTLVSENRCYLLTNNISMQECVPVGCALPTGMGMSALIGAKCHNCKTIVAIDTNTDRLEKALKLGATHIINAATENFAEITNNKMLYYAVEAASSCKTIENAFSLINRQTGECIFASHPPAGQKSK